MRAGGDGLLLPRRAAARLHERAAGRRRGYQPMRGRRWTRSQCPWSRPAHAIFGYEAPRRRRTTIMDAFAQVASTPLGGTPPPIHMSVYGLFMQADWVVKAVMIALLAGVVLVVGDHLEKTFRLRGAATSGAQRSRTRFWSGGRSRMSIAASARSPTHPMAALFSAAMREWRRSLSKGPADRRRVRAPACSQRIDQVMNVTIEREMEGIERTGLPRHRRRGRAVRRPVRHRVGHHERASPPIAAARTPRSRSSRPASPRRCSPPRSACSPRSRRSRLQHFATESARYAARLEALRRRVHRHPVAPARGAGADGRRSSRPSAAAAPAGRRRAAIAPIAEINVTPLVDVMLVLLIIFMVTAPLLQRRRAGRSAEDQRAAGRRKDEPLACRSLQGRGLPERDPVRARRTAAPSSRRRSGEARPARSSSAATRRSTTAT